KRVILLSILCLPLLLNAQTSVKGIVTEQNSGNKPIPGVQLKALGTTPELTDNAGLFQLLFTAKKPGDRIIVSEISKKGYEVVNKDVVNNWIITDNINDKTKIVMCPEGLIAQNTLKYYDISLSGLTKGYESRIKSLQEQKDKAEIDAKTYAEQAKALAEQFDNQQKQLEELSEKFARENFDDCSAIHKQAFDAFKNGNIEEAIRILESVNSEIEIAKAKKQQNKAENIISEGKEMLAQSEEIIRQNISKLMFQADLYVTSFRFPEAEQCYEAAVKADTTYFEGVFAFAKYFYENVKLEKSIIWHKKALALVTNDFNKSDVFYNLGVLMKNMQQFDSAETNFNKSIQIRRKLAESDPNVYNPLLANSLSGIADCQYVKGNFDESEMSLTEALNIYRRLDIIDPDVKDEIARLLSSLVDLMYKSDQLDKAKQYLTEAEKLYSELVSINYIEKKSHFAWVPCWALAGIQTKLGKLKEAEVNYNTSLNLFRKLAEKNPLLYNYKIATVLYELAGIQLLMKQLDKAEINALESVEMHKQIIRSQPWADINLVQSMIILYQIQCYERQFDKSEENFKEVINILKEHDKINPHESDYEIANIYSNFSAINYEMYQYEKGEKYSEEAINMYIVLAQSKPVYKYRLAECYSSSSFYEVQSKNFELAETMARKSLETDSTYIWGNSNLALAMLFNGKYEKAKNIYMSLKDKTIPGEKTKKFREAFLEDIEEMEKAGVTHPDVSKIKVLLK
ncbi:MAG: tetratricopeptide repeat protein, partial [Bacteroidia bacterium]|nr:tetratricopeptide repeat protein [Bacteroidia bacterium]